MTRPRLTGPALVPLSRATLFAAALVIAAGACKARPFGGARAENEATEQAGRSKAAAAAPRAAPAAPNSSSTASSATCELKRELQVWSDSTLVVENYGTHAVLQLIHRELEVEPGAKGTTVEGAAASRVCAVAQTRDLDRFLRAYRNLKPSTLLTTDFVGEVSGIGRRIGTFARDSVQRVVAPGDTANAKSGFTAGGDTNLAPPRSRVEVPRTWLAALIAAVAIAGGVLWHTLRGLSRKLPYEMERIQRNYHAMQASQLSEILSQSRSLPRALENTQRLTLAELRHQIGRVCTELAMVRESLARSTEQSSSPGTFSNWPADSGLGADGGGGPLLLAPEAYIQWENTTVDIRTAEGGSATIHADETVGVFTVRWARDAGTPAWLSVNPSAVLGAAYVARLDAAFRCERAFGGTGRYRTVHEALCTWDPHSGQGRVEQPGVVEEI